MIETLKMMNSVLEADKIDGDFNELVLQYRVTQAANILAFFFTRHYRLIQTIGGNFYLLTPQDLASFSLQELDKALNTYDLKTGVSFTSYFLRCLTNRLIVEQSGLAAYKRKSNYSLVDLEEYQDVVDTDFEIYKFSLKDYDLTPTQEQYCQLILDGYKKQNIAEIMHVSRQTLHDWNKKLKNIFNQLYEN